MKIAITGHRGFIGQHLVKALRGHEIILVNSLSLIPKVDVIYHLAAKASVPLSINQPYETYMSNVVGTLSVLEACRKTGAKLIFASSSQAQANALSPYGLQKYSCEELIAMYGRLYDVKYCILRFYSVFGKNDRSVISAFMKAEEAHQPLEVYGGGQLRDFVHIEAVIKKLLEAIELEGTYDVGSGVRWKVSQIADMISDNQIHRELKPYERMEARCVNPVQSMPVEEYVQAWKMSK